MSIKSQTLTGLPMGFDSLINQELSQYPEVRRATLFGSRAMGNHRKNSDIDLCLDASDMLFEDYLRLSTTLDELLFPYKLDLILMQHIDNPDLIEHINRVGVRVYEPRKGV